MFCTLCFFSNIQTFMHQYNNDMFTYANTKGKVYTHLYFRIYSQICICVFIYSCKRKFRIHPYIYGCVYISVSAGIHLQIHIYAFIHILSLYSYTYAFIYIFARIFIHAIKVHTAFINK